MSCLFPRLPLLGVPLAVCLFLCLVTAQTRSLSEEQLESYRRSLLADYYIGKAVRAKVTFPATAQGLEIKDGRLDVLPLSANQTVAARPGDLLIIKQVRFKRRSIEIEFAEKEVENEAHPPGSRKQQSSTLKPRLHVRFSRELTPHDLSLQNLNSLLAMALDVSSLAPQAIELPQATTSAKQPKQAAGPLPAKRDVQAQDIPIAPTVAELAAAAPNIAELTIECSIGRARVYINGAYSGWTPRTVRVIAGVHSILLVREGYTMWEQRFIIPAGKVSLVRAELKVATP